MDFGVKVLHLDANHLVNTPAFDLYFADLGPETDDLFRARVLAYALSTWRTHASSLKEFLKFCKSRELSPFDVTVSQLGVFMLWCARNGKTATAINGYLEGIAFLYRFYLVPQITDMPVIHQLKRFVGKVCGYPKKRKDAFGAAEVRRIWDEIDVQGGLQALDSVQLRTFMMAVFQHATFCRFSDLKGLQLDDLIFQTDMFKIHVGYSKTDQEGRGQWLIMPKSSSPYRDPHMLMCVYLHRLKLDSSQPAAQPLYLFPPLV